MVYVKIKKADKITAFGTGRGRKRDFFQLYTKHIGRYTIDICNKGD